MRRIFLKLIRRRRLHADLEAELAYHRELANAHQNSLPLGNTTAIKEQALDLWRFTILENFWRDCVYTVRGLRRNPGFTVAAVLSLALGIGITTAMFTLLNAVAFRPLPYPDSSRLVWMTQVLKSNSTDEITLTPDFLDWRKDNHSLTDLAAYNYVTRSLTEKDSAIEMETAKASAALLPLLGVQPLIGRNFSKAEDYAGHDHVVILTNSTWRHQFGSDPNVIGRPITLDGEQFTIVGVLPQEFVFPGPDPVQILTPLGKNEAAELARNGSYLTLVRNVIGRLKPGISREQARADLTILQSHLPPPAFHPTITIKMLPLREHLFGNAETAGFVLVAGSLFLMLVASANVGSLLLVRLMQRDRELAIRTVLGGSRTRLLSQLLTESTVLAVLSCSAGILLAYWMRSPFLALSPYLPAGTGSLPFDARVLLFAVVLSGLTVLLFGTLPAFRATEIRLSEAMKSGQSSIAGARGSARILSAIAISEIAAVVVLSSGAALTLQSFWKMRYANLGFQSDHLIAATLNLRPEHYRERPEQLAYSLRVPGLPPMFSINSLHNLRLSIMFMALLVGASEHPAPRSQQPTITRLIDSAMTCSPLSRL